MRCPITSTLLLFLWSMVLCSPSGFQSDERGSKLFLEHFRNHFDDIHDVSMRFHMKDPSIGGRIVFQMTWEDGHLVKGEVLENETGNADEAEALLVVIGGWKIDGLAEKTTFSIPFRIRLVGSNDPAFPETGILTGSVRDTSGKPLKGAEIRFVALEGQESKVPAARSNREGIFIRTLIPAGTWEAGCSLEGYESERISGITFSAGTHRVLHFVLE